MFWDHAGSNFSDLGQRGVPFFLRTIQHCHLLTLKDEPAGPPSTLANIHVCHVERGSHLPFKFPAAVSRGWRGARRPGAGAAWLSGTAPAPSFTSGLWHCRSCWCLATCLRAHGSSVYKHDPTTLTGSYERAASATSRARLT